jgi:hypothetical protein
MASEADGAEYLRRLRSEMESVTAALNSGSAQPSSQAAFVERRAVPRFPCQGSAQVKRDDSEVRSWGSITDISLHGCYVEMTAAFAVGTMVEIDIELAGKRAHVRGEVRASYPFLGMGIKFVEIAPEAKAELAEMVRAVSRSVRLIVPHADSAWRKPAITDPKRAMDAVTGFFEQHGKMTREDLMRILEEAGA